MDRLFLDANILFSAAYGLTSTLLDFWKLDDVCLLTSDYAINEAWRNLRTSEQRDRLSELLKSVEVVASTDGGWISLDLPEKDRPILLAAINVRATHLITGDRKHFGRYVGQIIANVMIVSPMAYFDLLSEQTNEE